MKIGKKIHTFNIQGNEFNYNCYSILVKKFQLVFCPANLNFNLIEVTKVRLL